MAIQHRRGNYADFDKSKMVAGEFAVVLQNDPETSDGKSVYIAFNSGSAKRLMTKEDLQDGIEAATQEVVDAITEATAQDVEDAQTAASEAAESASEAASVIPELNQENAVAGTALQLMSSNYTSDSTPYLYRTTGGGVAVGTREMDEIVGGSVGWNQHLPTRNISRTATNYTVTSNNNGKVVITVQSACSYENANEFTIGASEFTQNHIYLSTTGRNDISMLLKAIPVSGNTIFKLTSSPNACNVCFTFRNLSAGTYEFYPQLFDLTQMFGSTIADYIYNLEQATAGAGVAKLKEWGFFTEDYYAYDAGSLQSVNGVSAHIMRDSDDNIIGNYPLDSSVTLRGILKLDSNNKLYFDGDTYEADGTVTRKFGIVNLGSLTWNYVSGVTYPSFAATLTSNTPKPVSNGTTANIVCARFTVASVTAGTSGTQTNCIGVNDAGAIVVHTNDYTDAAAFKSAMNGVYLVYELATPTTETADPYASVQICAEGGTEEYITTGIVPVGHNTKYPANLRERLDSIPDLPTTAGTYRLSVTIVSGKPVYQWVTT